MKKTKVIGFAFLAGLFAAFVCSSIWDSRSSVKMETFHAAGLDMPVLFEDVPHLSYELRSAIIEDLNFVYAHMSRYEMLKLKPVSFVVEGQTITSTAYVMLDGGVRVRPDAHHDAFGIVVNINGVQNLLIPKRLIDAYRDKMKFRKEHRAEFKRLENALARFSSSDPKRFDDVSIADLVLLPKSRPLSPELNKHLSETMTTIHLRRPTFLGVSAVSDEDARALSLAPGALVANAIFLDEKGLITANYLPFVYAEGKWRMVLDLGQ